MDKLMDKALTMGISMAGGLAATKAFEFAWEKATGEQAPKHDDVDNVTIKKALVFAVTSAAITATVQILSQRGAKAATKKLRSGYGKRSEV
ncbi:DUF4235 domain-containing protein [Nesterenkonia flava]|uniref:DUF4235 domain-containing protein n=1 Tax=Nesterenkonia flava TaxID=469799 RepID=A0ABU1FWD1_9MICC|nr:DUF4235 domain-containing protein [Nesterenkonia flava]MDR5712981.1 DUF4235 domain-containing protein [Nesterenkonia flava]